MNILVLGSGGREHAITWKLKQSKNANQLWVAPGNAGTAAIANNVEINVNDFDKIAKFILDKKIDLIVVGPEDPLVNGITDFFRLKKEFDNLMIIGPGKQGAKLEGSKEYAKQFMTKYNIPTAAYKSFTLENIEQAFIFLDELNPPFVLKADGLAAGKGVLILSDRKQAKESLKEMLDGKFGEAGKKVVIEQFLDGIEYSVFVLTDGESYKILPEAKDYKRIGEGDTGLNTGGMGAVSPVPFFNSNLRKKTEEKIIIPTINGLKQEGIDYKGFIFLGLIKVGDEPYVIEYNVRLGDPETEVVIPRIHSDLCDLLKAVAKGNLSEAEMEITNSAAATVMAVSGGYPGNYEKDKIITGTENITDSVIFHAGTKLKNGDILTSGGRVIAVSSFAADIFSALKISYGNLEKIQFDKIYYRKDLGFDLK
jgi:phosphoribosylamine---glycine ligase